MEYLYKTSGVCAGEIQIKCTGDVIDHVQFFGGCNGNGKGVAALSVGRTMDEVIERCEGITCGFKKTSCPDQLAKALREIKKQQGK